jgi:tRNA threonylcarbamoyladenosine modification (KEOPS) complex  Pcc1 subunit
VGGNNELRRLVNPGLSSFAPHSEHGLIYERSGSCSYCLVSSDSNLVRGFLVIASITPAVNKEIFETVEISKFSIWSSCSCVKLPSRRLNLRNCVRATSLASLRAAFVSFLALTPGLSIFLSKRASFQIYFARKKTQIGTTTFTGLYDPALNDHLSRALTICSQRRNRNVLCNLPILSLDYFDGSFHNNNT